jgi:ankyrin repeat protein
LLIQIVILILQHNDKYFPIYPEKLNNLFLSKNPQMELELHKILAASYENICMTNANDKYANFTMNIDKYLPYINAKDAHGYTPLLLAIMYRFDLMVQILVGAGADANMLYYNRCNNQNEFALSLYFDTLDPDEINFKKDEILRLLISKTDFNNDYIRKTIIDMWATLTHGHTKFFKLLLNNGLDINKYYNDGPILHYIITKNGYRFDYDNYRKLIKTCLKNGANIDIMVGKDTLFYILIKRFSAKIDNLLLLIMVYYNKIITEYCVLNNPIVIMFNDRIKLQNKIEELKAQLLMAKSQIADVNTQLSAFSFLPPDSSGTEYLAASANFAAKKIE